MVLAENPHHVDDIRFAYNSLKAYLHRLVPSDVSGAELVEEHFDTVEDFASNINQAVERIQK